MTKNACHYDDETPCPTEATAQVTGTVRGRIVIGPAEQMCAHHAEVAAKGLWVMYPSEARTLILTLAPGAGVPA